MRYRVQGLVAPIAGGVLHVSTEPIYEWYQEAESHLDAAGKFILDHPEVNQSPLLVCDEDYVMGNYPYHIRTYDRRRARRRKPFGGNDLQLFLLILLNMVDMLK